MPNFLVFHVGQRTKADILGGQWVGTAITMVNAADESAAMKAAATTFGHGGRFGAFAASALVTGVVPEQMTFGNTTLDP